jgi:hypothetical protein
MAPPSEQNFSMQSKVLLNESLDKLGGTYTQAKIIFVLLLRKISVATISTSEKVDISVSFTEEFNRLHTNTHTPPAGHLHTLSSL